MRREPNIHSASAKNSPCLSVNNPTDGDDLNEDMVVIKLLDVLGERVKEEEVVEGMEHEHDHDGDLDHKEEEPEFDEHVWLSLNNAALFCRAIADALAQLDPGHEEAYQANAAAYGEKLSALDAEYRAAVDAASTRTLLFGDRFPFRYLVDDYGLSYYAAFAGCSAETEASFETIVFLAEKADELKLHAVCQIESADGSIARTICENTRSGDQEILTFDSMQSATSRDAAAGGYADGDSFDELREKGFALHEVLQANDAYHALRAVDGLIVTGPTGTNVNDLYLGLIDAE